MFLHWHMLQALAWDQSQEVEPEEDQESEEAQFVIYRVMVTQPWSRYNHVGAFSTRFGSDVNLEATVSEDQHSCSFPGSSYQLHQISPDFRMG